MHRLSSDKAALLCSCWLQALQQVFRQEVSSGRARQSQLQDALHQRLTEVETARAQLATVQKEQAAAAGEQQGLKRQLQDAQRANLELQQRLDTVGLALPGRGSKRC